jgi:CRISPR/Cas system CSM-associated protein Csm3 (group 7 of RAMP superfamily)
MANSFPFKNRWRIQGEFTTVSPLHIGNGDVTTRTPEYLQGVEISAVLTDHRGCAYIPATSLKGSLRAWLEAVGAPNIRALFGTQDEGGKAEIWDAPVLRSPNPPPQDRAWHSGRVTQVAAAVALDRSTRTAVDKKLFHYEYVPPGTVFELNICGQDLDPQEVAILLLALQSFDNAQQPPSLGSETGNGWGRFHWKRTQLRYLDADGVRQWLQKADPETGWEAPQAAPSSLDSTVEAALKTLRSQFTNADSSLTIEVELAFNSNFVVNDNSRTGKGREFPDHAPLREWSTATQRALLPARSVRGAFRSQAERIFRTIGGLGPNLNDNGITQPDQLAHLHPVSKLFGTAGWRSPVQFSDFNIVSGQPPAEASQDFVAIDRFTGGGADAKKFNALSVYKPVFRGRITADLNALAAAGVDGWGWLLLALTLRDLQEGDITFGFGASKGYASCRGELKSISGGGEVSADLLAMVQRQETTALRAKVQESFHELKKQAESSHRKEAK